MIAPEPNPQTLALHNLLAPLVSRCSDYILLGVTSEDRTYPSRMMPVLDKESFASDIRSNGFCVVAVHGTLAVIAHEYYSPTPAF